MQLYEKKKILNFFYQILKSRLNYENFQKKDDPYSWCSSEITDSKNVVK